MTTPPNPPPWDGSPGQAAIGAHRLGRRLRALPVRQFVAVVSILTTATVALAGCSTAGDAPPAADPAALDAGNYPTEPRPDLGRAGDLGVYVEARRMADFVTMPFDVDRDLTGGYSQGAINGVVKSASSLRSTLRISVPDGAANNFVNGFTVQRASAGSRGLYLQNTVLRYGSPADARVAADELTGKGAKLAAPLMRTHRRTATSRFRAARRAAASPGRRRTTISSSSPPTDRMCWSSRRPPKTRMLQLIWWYAPWTSRFR